jgi:broad specificity phosphatase PhoE
MKRAVWLALTIVVLVASVRPAAAQEVIYIVRHAERANQSADSELSTEGVGRSYKLRDVLRNAGVTRIFTSPLRRTVDTAAPLAAALHVTPRAIATDEALLEAIAGSGPRDRVLVVGHSNTVPALLRGLHVAETVTLADDEYDNLFIVFSAKEGRPVLLRLKY